MSQTFDDPRREGVIRISAEDTASSHVDDLLRRQASLRGEQGIAANRKRKWYYRNWFVFMIAGLAGALAAWALVEPHFRDSPYYQGKIAEIDLEGYPRDNISLGAAALRLPNVEFAARLRINNETIYLLSVTRQVQRGRGVGVVDPHELKLGQEVGLYVNRERDIQDADDRPADVDEGVRDGRGGVRQGGTWVIHAEKPRYALFVDLSPPPRAEAMGPLKQEETAGHIFALLLLPAVAGAVGLCIGAADGIVCRLLRRVLLGGVVGLLVGLVGGFVFQFLAGLIYMPFNHLGCSNIPPPAAASPRSASSRK